MSELLKQYSPKNESFKQYSSPFTAFNSWKVMFHAERMQNILDWLDDDSFKLPPPVYVTIDPTNVCSHACPWCISAHIQESDNTTLKPHLMNTLVHALYDWVFPENNKMYVQSIVLAGGGEPLVNKGTFDLIRELSFIRRKSGMEFAMITNGELLTEEIAAVFAEYGTWLGFSVDSGNSVDHRKMHAPKKKNIDAFDKIIQNIKLVCDLRKSFPNRETPLNVGYKFNIHPDSYESMVEGAKIAKEIGCDQIQFKPTYVDNAVDVMPPIIEEAQQNILKARELYEDDKFKVTGVIHKFGPSWEPNHDFGSCTMTPLGLIFSADGNMYLCCDRRGDPKLNLGPWHNGKEAKLDMIEEAWGSEKHRKMIKEINTKECPRCTMYFYNKVVQEAFIKDNMNRSFL